MNKPSHIGAIHTSFTVQMDFEYTQRAVGLALDMLGTKYKLQRSLGATDDVFRAAILDAIVEMSRKIWGGP